MSPREDGYLSRDEVEEALHIDAGGAFVFCDTCRADDGDAPLCDACNTNAGLVISAQRVAVAVQRERVVSEAALHRRAIKADIIIKDVSRFLRGAAKARDRMSHHWPLGSAEDECDLLAAADAIERHDWRKP